MTPSEIIVLNKHTDALKNHTDSLTAHTTALKENNEKLGSIHNILTDTLPHLKENNGAIEKLQEEIVSLRDAINNQ